MNLESKIRKRIIVSLLILALAMPTFVKVASAATTPGNTNVMKANLVRTVNFDPSASTPLFLGQGPAIDVPPGDARDSQIPGKASQLAMALDQGPSNTDGNDKALQTPVVQGSDVSLNPADTQSAKGLNAFDFTSTHGGLSVEPPDQMLCVGTGYVLEGVNDNIRVYSIGLTPVSSAKAIEGFFGAPQGSTSDPKCYWDADTGHWFVTVTLPFFKGISFVALAVSQTTSPLGLWNIYVIDTTDNGTDGTPSNPGCPCIADQPLLGANRDAIFISTNEYGATTFNGANMYVIDKAGLAAGLSSVNAELLLLGLTLPTPDGACDPSVGAPCWYTVQPATSPSSQYDNRFSGTEYALSALQFFSAKPLDNRIAVWAFTNTASIVSVTPSVGVQFKVIESETYEQPLVFAHQKAGPTPKGDTCKAVGCNGTPASAFTTFSFPGPIQPNDDRMQQVVFANGLLWSGLNTAVKVVDTEGNLDPKIHNGIAYFVVQPKWSHTTLKASIEEQGYVAVSKSDVLFPSIGVTADGHGVIAFTLTGPDFYPSAAFVTVGDAEGGNDVRVAALGQSPADGFSEYRNFGTPAYRPRWGDYSAAVAFGSHIFFSTEYIQYPNCSDIVYSSDITCGSTRARSSNWGTSLSVFTT